MSESPKNSGFRRWLKPAGMMLLIASASGIGGFAANYTLNRKPLNSEANHSKAGEDHATDEEKLSAEISSGDHAAGNLADGSSDSHGHSSKPHNKSSESHETAHKDSRHTVESLFPDESAGDESADHGAAPEDASIAAAHDPFSEESLGLEPAAIEETHSAHANTRDSARHNDHAESHEDSHVTSSPGSKPHDDAPDHDATIDHDTVDQDLHAVRSPKSSAKQDQHAPVNLSDSHAERKSATEEHAPLVAESSTPTRQDRITQQAVNFMAMADEELAAGNYVEAMRAYQALRKKADGIPGPALLFRLALCAEAAGRHAAAIEAYRRISGTQTDPAWTGVARYGEARCLVATKKHKGLQSDLLRRAILDETELLPTVRGEVLHLIGRDLWREQTTMVNAKLLDDSTLVVPEWSADPLRLLDELPLLIHETPVKRGPVEFQVLAMEESRPEGISVRLNCSLTRLDTLITKLVKGCRLKCEISEAAAEVIEGRSQHVSIQDRNLALLLDGLTIPWGLTWTWSSETVRILHPSELPDEVLRTNRLNAAERILRIAVIEGANSVQIGHSRLALSTLLFEQKRAADAVQFLQLQIETAPRSVVAAEAGFNLGKCLMALNERNDSKLAFLKSIDASGGPIDVKVASYIFHCRMLLEEGHHQQAIISMMRGLALSEGSELEPWAALQLASAYLLNNVPQGSNSVLMAHNASFAEGDAKSAGAFAAALSRFRAAVLADRREREGADVVAALAEYNPAESCGGHWAVLVAGACEELGLTQQAGEAYSLALQRLPTCVLKDATTLKLAEHYKQENEPEQARLLLTSLTSTQAGELAIEARLETAQLALEQNRLNDAIKLSRELFVSTKSRPIQRSALKIMGKAYERQKNHEAAIYCFSGSLPDAPVSTDAGHASPEVQGEH